MVRKPFGEATYAPTGDFDLLDDVCRRGRADGLKLHVGSVLTSDVFYDDEGSWRPWAAHGVLAVEMETAALYTVAARAGRRALSVLTVSDLVYDLLSSDSSDNVPAQQAMTADEREASTMLMVRLVLGALFDS